MSNVKKTKSVEVGNQFSLPYLRSDCFLSRLGVASLFQPAGGRIVTREKKRDGGRVVKSRAAQLRFDGSADECEVFIPVDSDIWAKLPDKRQAG